MSKPKKHPAKFYVFHKDSIAQLQRDLQAYPDPEFLKVWIEEDDVDPAAIAQGTSALTSGESRAFIQVLPSATTADEDCPDPINDTTQCPGRPGCP